jgi:hypothetical protein
MRERPSDRAIAQAERFTPRDVAREVLGREWADGIIANVSPEWAVFMTVCTIEARGGPANERERAFLDWVDRNARNGND